MFSVLKACEDKSSTITLAFPACQWRGTASLPQILTPPACRGRGIAFPNSCFPPLAGGGGPRSGGRGVLQLLTAIISTLQSSPLLSRCYSGGPYGQEIHDARRLHPIEKGERTSKKHDTGRKKTVVPLPSKTPLPLL